MTRKIQLRGYVFEDGKLKQDKQAHDASARKKQQKDAIKFGRNKGRRGKKS